MTRQVERTPVDRTGGHTGAGDSGGGFWAMLIGTDVSGLRYTFNRVTPEPKSTHPEAFTLSNTLRFGFEGGPVFDAACEVNGTRGLNLGTIVWMRFGGYATDERPMFFFAHANPEQFMPSRPHDHRDNDEGGFAFSVFHPGTSLPQMPFPY